jgi:hypothetical protein
MRRQEEPGAAEREDPLCLAGPIPSLVPSLCPSLQYSVVPALQWTVDSAAVGPVPESC